MKIVSLFLIILLSVSIPHAYDPVDEQSNQQTNQQGVAPAAADTTVAPVAMSIDPVLARVLGWSLATTGFFMAVSGTGLLGTNDGCTLIQGFNCDRDQQQRQFFLLGGGALIGSLGAVLVWAADIPPTQTGEQDASSKLPVAPPPPKNMWVGMGLGLAGSAVGTMLIWNEPSVAQGMLGIVAPSLGQVYAGTNYGTVASLFVRGFGGFMLAKNYMDCRFADECDPDYAIGKIIFMSGVGISLYDTWRAVRRSEGHARAASASTFSLSPALFPVGDDRLAPGLAFSTMF